MLISGLAVRLAISPFFAHPFDVYSWYVNGQNLLNGSQSIQSFMIPYSYSFFLFAFPASLILSQLTPYIGSGVIPISSLNPALNPGPQWGITVVPGLLFDFLVKLPLIASDCLVTIVIYRIVMGQTQNKRAADSAAMMWFLNPLTIWISSGWGMMDTIPAFFSTLAVLLMMERRFRFSGFSMAVAAAMKYYAAVLVFPLLLLSWRRGGRDGLVRSASGVALGGLALLLPTLNQTISGFTYIVTVPLGASFHYSGLSFWTALTLFSPIADQTLISLTSAGILTLLVYLLMWRHSHSSDFTLSMSAFATPIAVLLLAYRFVGENYFIWLLPFAAILALKSSRGRALFWFLSLTALLSSVVDSLLPYYMLPMAPWIGGYLVEALSFVSPYRVAPIGEVALGLTAGKLVLAALGVVSAVVVFLMILDWTNVRARDIPDRLLHRGGTRLMRAIDSSHERP